MKSGHLIPRSWLTSNLLESLKKTSKDLNPTNEEAIEGLFTPLYKRDDVEATRTFIFCDFTLKIYKVISI